MGKGVRVFVHFMHYCVVLPFCGAFAFLLYRYLPEPDLSIGTAIIAAAFGALIGLPFVLLVGITLAVILLPAILLLNCKQVVLVNLLAVMAAPWIVIKSDPYFLEHSVFVTAASALLAGATTVVYARFEIFAILKNPDVIPSSGNRTEGDAADLRKSKP